MVLGWTLALLAHSHSLVVGQGPPASAAYQKALYEAQQLLNQGDLDAVIEKLTPWVEENPNRPQAQHGLGIAYYEQKNFVRTIQHLSVALKLEAENSPAWKQTVEILAMSYYFNNRPQDALFLLEKAVTSRADDANLLYTLAMTYLHTHDRDNARRRFAKLFDVPPESPQAYILAADLMVQEHYVDDGEALVLKALEKEPDLPLVSYKLGLIALTRGQFSEAVQYLEQELSSNPGHSNAWHYLGDAYIRLGEPEKAIDPLQRSIWLNLKSTRSYVLLANVYARQERLFVAENTLKRALYIEPRNYEARFQLARIYHKTNRAELAKKELATANELSRESETNPLGAARPNPLRQAGP